VKAGTGAKTIDAAFGGPDGNDLPASGQSHSALLLLAAPQRAHRTAEQMLTAQAQAIARVPRRVGRREEERPLDDPEAVLRFMAERGVEALYKNFPKLVAFARTRWPWLPDIGLDDS
jgi:hypothetical protein